MKLTCTVELCDPAKETRLPNRMKEQNRKNDNIAGIMRFWMIVHIFAPTKNEMHNMAL